MDKPKLANASFTFWQEGNSDGTTDDIEEITISVAGTLTVSDGYYYTIKTETGWSINDISELEDIFNRISKTINNET